MLHARRILAVMTMPLWTWSAVAWASGTLVEGTVKVAGPAAKPAPVKITKDASSCGSEYAADTVSAGPEGGLANVVVSLRAVKAVAATTPPPQPPPPGRATLDQIGCRYVPHVQAVGVGSELTLVNSDRVLHNVHGNLGPVTVFNVAMPIKGQRLPTRLTRPGLVRLQCDAGHSWMNAWVYVFDHSHYAVTDAQGHFLIRDVPPGEYTLEYWHEPIDGKGPGTTKTSRLKVGEKSTRADSTLRL